jgi:vacuolar-type H+-ATPase subunit H
MAHNTGKSPSQTGGTKSESADKPQSKTTSIVEIPSNVNFSLKSEFSKLIYDSLNMDNVTGKLSIANNVLQIDNLMMDAVDGKMIVNGSYSTVKPDKPEIDFQINMKNLSIPKAYNNFAIIRNYLPLAKKTTGTLSANFKLSTALDEKMMPIYSTMNGKGTLSTSKITINDLNSLLQVANKLNLTEFKHLEVNGININFMFVDGKLVVKPTKVNYKNIDGEIEGWTGFDKTIDYTLNVEVPRKEFGSDANKLLDGLLAQANSYGANFTVSDKIPISIFIGGTLDNPKVSTAFTKGNSSTDAKNTEQVIKEVVKKEKDKLSKDASAKAKKIIDDADKQAKQIIKEAEKQAKLIKENASQAKKDLLSETDKQAKALIAEGKKNGPIAEMAANEAAKQLVSGVQDNADNIIKEANKKADDIIKNAKATSRKLREEADIQAKKAGGAK